jgi:hypothetical protein
MKRILHRFLLGGAVLGLVAGVSSAAVTLTESTFVPGPDATVPVYVLENQWIKVLIAKSPTQWLNAGVPATDTTGMGSVVALYDKSGPIPTASQLTVISGTAPYYGTKGFSAFRDRMDAKDPIWDGVTVTGTVDAGNTVATVTVDEDAGSAGFKIHKVYSLTDNQKWLKVDFGWQNTNATPYARPDSSSSSAIESIIYATVGGAKDANDESFAMVATNTVAGSEAVPGLNATVGNAWYGHGGTNTLYPELTQGWLADVDAANNSTLVTTWDLEQQRAADNGQGSVRGGSFGSRFTFEILYQNIPANDTLNFTHNLIVDNDLASVSYAKEGQLIAAIDANKAYNLNSTVTGTFKLNSLNPTDSVTYDIKNIHVENRATGTSVSGISLADITGVKVAANTHVTAGTRQFTPQSPAFTVGQSYVIKGDLYVSGQATPVTTLSSRPFQVNAADSKVFLYKDIASGDYILENEVYRATISASTGQITFFYLKDPVTGDLIRSETVTSTPPYPMFRDYVEPDGAQHAFANYVATLDPDGTDTGTHRTLQFTASDNDGFAGLTKTYSLDSLSRSLAVHVNVANVGFSDIDGGGYYSEVPMAPGGTAGGSDQLTAHSAAGLVATHPDQATDLTADKQIWYGAKDDGGNIVPGDLPELDQPWIAMRDSGTTDALALTWNLDDQKTFSGVPSGGSAKVTMNSVLFKRDYANQIPRVHFVGITGAAALDTTMYLLADTGFNIVSYAEANRVMAGIWATNSNNPVGGPLGGSIGLTNTSTTAKTFDVKNIHIVKDTGESTPAGADILGIAIDPAAHAAPAIAFTIPSGQAQGSYTLVADLYEGATKVATLQSLPFNITAAAPGATGDVNGDSAVDKLDVQAALKIAGGLTAADAGNITRGDLNADGKITVADAVAISQKANTQ